jgi:Fic family protein
MEPFVPQVLPITEVAWIELLPTIGLANRNLAEYNGVLHTFANPELLLSPLTTQEAVLSSKIEGTQATLGEVLKFEAGEEPEQESRRQDIHEIINYRRALREAETELQTRPFSLNLLLKLHSTLLDSVRGRNKARGSFRNEQNWIGAPGSTIEQAEFVPPAPGDQFKKALYDWETYYHTNSPDALVQLAIVHAQFEILHPFLDGNGRLGRILIPLFLFEKKILSRPTFYLSEYLESNRETYIRFLRNLGKSGDAWNNWIRFFLDGLIEQARNNVQKAKEIHALYERLKHRVLGLTHSQFAVPMLDLMFEQPIFSTTFLMMASDLDTKPSLPSKPMVMNILGKLKSAGILKIVREGRGARAQILALAELVNLCEGKQVV